MMRSPGSAESIAFCTALFEAFSPSMYFGALPATVTVIASIDFLPLPAVMTSCPQRAEFPTLGGVVLWGMVQVDCDELRFGTEILIWLSLQDVIVAGTPAIVTLDAVLQDAFPAVGLVQRVPKP